MEVGSCPQLTSPTSGGIIGSRTKVTDILLLLLLLLVAVLSIIEEFILRAGIAELL
jgi:hypothetical protein